MTIASIRPRATNFFQTARGIVLMSLAIVGIACMALAFHLVDKHAARQIWKAVGSH